MFGIPEDFKLSIAQRNAELLRMFPDINCDFEDSNLLPRTMWPSFLDSARGK